MQFSNCLLHITNKKCSTRACVHSYLTLGVDNNENSFVSRVFGRKFEHPITPVFPSVKTERCLNTVSENTLFDTFYLMHFFFFFS